MAVSASEVQKAYLAYFGRPADPLGLTYWQNAASVDAMKAGFAGSAEYASLYSGMNSAARVNQVYLNVLGRAAEPAGLTYWAAQLDAGTLTVGNLAWTIINAAQNEDAVTVANRITYATGFTAAVDTTAEIIGYSGDSAAAAARAAVLPVTTSASLATAQAALPTTIETVTAAGSSSSGQTFTLTTATDIVTGTANNDLIIGDWGTTTVNASDQVNGGAGTDVLKVYGALGTLPASVTNVETVTLVNPATMTITDTTLGLGSSVTRLSVEQVAGAGTVTTTSRSGLTLDLATLNNGTAVGVTWAANASDTSQTLELSGLAGATSAVASAVTVTGAATTTMNVNTDTAASKVTILTAPATTTTMNIAAAANLTVGTAGAADGLVGASIKTLNISGAGKVTVQGTSTDLAATLTVDGSTNTGGVLYTDEAAGSTLTFKGGSGNDAVTFAAGNLTSADVLTGGTGTDTLAINDIALTTAGNLAAVNAASGFEILGLGTTGAELDMSLLTNGITNVAIGSGNISATTTNSLAASTYTIDNSLGNTGTVSIGNKVGELATTVTLDYGTATAAKTLAALTVNGATSVSLVSTGTGSGGSNIITDLNNMDNSVITVTGAKDLTVTNALDGTGTGSKLDGTNFTGKLNITGSGLADILIGGSGNDTFNGGAGLDTITAGAGADTITVNVASQADVNTLGAGADTIKFSGTSTTMMTTSTGTSAIVSITDFAAGTDKIGLVNSTGAFTSVTLATQTIATAADLTAVWSGISAVAASATSGAASAVLVTVSAGAAAGSYLYVNDTTGAVSNTADMLVKVTGLTGTLAATDFVFA